jgi:hypothetical protein
MDSDRYVSKAKLARRLGITRQALQRAGNIGRIDLNPKGKVDMQGGNTVAFIATHGELKNPPTKPKPKRGDRPENYMNNLFFGPSSEGPPADPVVEDVRGDVAERPEFTDEEKKDAVTWEDISESNKAASNPDPVAVERMIRSDLEKQKLIESILAMQVKTAKERKELVACETVVKVFAKLAAVDTSEFHSLADKIAGDVAALCGLEDSETRVKIKELINKPVFRALKHRKRLMDDYLKKMGNS